MEKKILKDWTILEIVLLLAGIALSTIISIIFKSNWLALLCSIVSVITVILQAKGKVVANLFGIALVFLYGYVSYKTKLYGESILYLVAMLPLFVYSFFNWLKNRRKNQTVIAYDITGFEWAAVSVLQPVVFVGLYYFLGALNTELLLFSTLSFVSQIYALYLGARRCKYSFLWYLINDVVLIVLWSTLSAQGNADALPIIISSVMNCVYDVYGVINWHKMNEKVILFSDLAFKRLTKKDARKMAKLIETATEELRDKSFIEQYSEFDKKVMYNDTYTLLYGIFYQSQLIGKSEIILDQERTKECKEILGIEEYKACQIKRTLDLEQFSGKQVLYNLLKFEIQTVKDLAYNYLIAYADPDDTIGKNAIKQAKFKYVKTALIPSIGKERDIYLYKF